MLRFLYPKKAPALLFSLCFFTAAAQTPSKPLHIIRPPELRSVKINDPFWSPKLDVWRTQTVYDVFDKLEGNYVPDRDDLIKEQKELGHTRNAFQNFDDVAAGKKETKRSDGPPWYDGLVYETIRGAADLLVSYPDQKLENRIDGYITRISAAQKADPDGYINTWTTLNEPGHRWGLNGGNDRWQHDVYNAGMLVEAGVHYYRATGKTALLTVATKMANYMCAVMGVAPKLNVIPAHAGPEEAFLKLYQLYRDEPVLKKKVGVPVKEQQYSDLVKYWIETRGVYADADGSRKRHSDGSYNQDQASVFEQQTIEGHAVRATLLATGIAAMALENKDPRYTLTANRYWDNMVGKRTFITGGQGAIAEDEKFGPDYFLPQDAYLETCASVGAAFFSERMNELYADAKYVDEFERVIYNNMLSSVAADGRHYHYENPLATQDHKRWAWHSCPCCPPMFLKMIGALPGFIYATDDKNLYVNLFIGSSAKITLGKTPVDIQQQTGYPFDGAVSLTIQPAQPVNFPVHIRIPGWANGKENPFGLYTSATPEKASVEVNGQKVPLKIVDGYAVIERKWKKGDRISVHIPVQPRIVIAQHEVKNLNNRFAIAAGPLVYAFENQTNPVLSQKDAVISRGDLRFDTTAPGTISLSAANTTGQTVQMKAIPFFSIGNKGSTAYRVWLASGDGKK
ncbi:MAG: glycoside hydrolase family 127 protein [Mucilaginibacter polytrichastri]|nr:glycoside hydrolase family 127 protein [Mucilaginibacter polytrichastri]